MSATLCFFLVGELKLMPAGQTSVDTMAITTQTFPVIFMTKIASLPKVAILLNPPELLLAVQWEQQKNVKTYQLFGIIENQFIIHLKYPQAYLKPDVTMCFT